MKLKAYSAEQTAEIINVFSKPFNGEAKQKLAKKLNKSIDALASKYAYERSRDENGVAQIRTNKVNRKSSVKPIANKMSDVIVTHINEPVTIIEVGNAKITLNVNKFKVDDTLIEC